MLSKPGNQVGQSAGILLISASILGVEQNGKAICPEHVKKTYLLPRAERSRLMADYRNIRLKDEKNYRLACRVRVM